MLGGGKPGFIGSPRNCKQLDFANLAGGCGFAKFIPGFHKRVRKVFLVRELVDQTRGPWIEAFLESARRLQLAISPCFSTGP